MDLKKSGVKTPLFFVWAGFYNGTVPYLDKGACALGRIGVGRLVFFMEAVLRLEIPGTFIIPWRQIMRGCLVLILTGILCICVHNCTEDMEERSEADAAELQNTVKGISDKLAGISGNRAGNIDILGITDHDIIKFPGSINPDIIGSLGHTDSGIIEFPGFMYPDITDIPRHTDSGIADFPGFTAPGVIESPGLNGSGITDIPGIKDPGIIETPGFTAPDITNPPDAGDSDIVESPGLTGPDTAYPPDNIDSDITESPGFTGPDAAYPPDNTDSDITESPGFTGPDIADIPGIKDPDTEDPPGVKDPDTADIPGIKDPDTEGPPGIIDSDPTDIGAAENPSESGEADSETGEGPAAAEDEDTSAEDTSKDDTSEDASGLELIEGFEVDAEGYITGCTNQVVIIDDILLLPASTRCAGIRKGALDSVGSMVVEVYIPANICDIEKGAFDRFLSLMFFEVSEENPYYYSLDGILYAASEEAVAYPAGR